MRWFVPFALLTGVVGCASASSDNPGGGDGGGGSGSDASGPRPDGPVIPADAPIDAPISVTLSQTTSTTNIMSNSTTCGTGENSWYRVFPLAESGVNGPLYITQVTFGAQEAAGAPIADVKLGTYTGAVGGTTLDVAQITPLANTTATIPALTNPGNTIVAPITTTVPAGSNLVVEIHVASNGTSKYLYIGASNAGETKPGYARAPGCVDANQNPVTTPTSTAALGRPTSHLNITVTGTH